MAIDIKDLRETSIDKAIDEILRHYKVWCEDGEQWEKLQENLVEYVQDIAYCAYVDGMDEQEKEEKPKLIVGHC